jgi:hypothetical protein
MLPKPQRLRPGLALLPALALVPKPLHPLALRHLGELALRDASLPRLRAIRDYQKMQDERRMKRWARGAH